jgi:hypothetical protein
MLIQLTPEQCTIYWEDLSTGIKNSMPPFAAVTDEGLNRVLENLLNGTMQAWVALDRNEKGSFVVAAAITMIHSEIGTGQKNLLIYSLFGYKFVQESIWKEGLSGIRQFAKSMECLKVIAYTSVPRVVEIAKSLGGSAEYTFLSWEV